MLPVGSMPQPAGGVAAANVSSGSCSSGRTMPSMGALTTIFSPGNRVSSAVFALPPKSLSKKPIEKTFLPHMFLSKIAY